MGSWFDIPLEDIVWSVEIDSFFMGAFNMMYLADIKRGEGARWRGDDGG